MATDYKIVKDKKLQDLEVKVVASIGNGWQPQGSVTYAVDEKDGEGYLMQAMIKP